VEDLDRRVRSRQPAPQTLQELQQALEQEVRPNVVVLKNFPTKVHCGKHVWCQNLISVSSGVKVAVYVHQLSFSSAAG
jgi:hypothetical protein